MGSTKITKRIVLSTKELIEKSAPDFKGVYILYNFHEEVIYIGWAEQSIKKSLLEYLSDSSRPVTTEVYYFSAVFDSNPSQKVLHLLYLYNRYSGRVPLLNESQLKAS